MSGELRRLDPDEEVGIYACGPTVYSRIHIGNARPFVVFTLLTRFLRSEGYRARLAINVTDINDKIYTAAEAAGTNSAALASLMTEAYFEDTGRLGIGRPDAEPLATATIEPIIELIADLVEGGHAYASGGDVYFSVRSFDGYGKLSHRPMEDMEQGEGDDAVVYVLEVNPRASRTVPFVSKATGQPLAKIAARCQAGTTLAAQGFTEEAIPTLFNVKESVFPFNKFPGIDPILGPEMKSTGEVMGVGATFAEAFLKAQVAAGEDLPRGGVAFLSVREVDKPGAVGVARDLVSMGFSLVATRGTAALIQAAGIPVEVVNKVREGRPHIVDMIKNDRIQLIINTTEGRQAIADSSTIRSSAQAHNVYYTTTLAGGEAVCMALRHGPDVSVRCLQEIHGRLA